MQRMELKVGAGQTFLRIGDKTRRDNGDSFDLPVLTYVLIYET